MTPEDKALCEALESGCGHVAGPDRCVAAAARIRALAALAEARREDIGRLHARVGALSDKVEQLKADIAAWPVCEDHKPGVWDGGRRCVVCEAHEEHAETKALGDALEWLRPIAESMRGQDNRATAHPVYAVETKTGRMGGYEFVTAFFSEAAADVYVASNAHNLKKPRVFVYSANRNREWQAVRACLLALLAEHGAKGGGR